MTRQRPIEHTPKTRQPRMLKVGDRVVHKTDLADAGTVVELVDHTGYGPGYGQGNAGGPGARRTVTNYRVRWDASGEVPASKYFRSELKAI